MGKEEDVFIALLNSKGALGIGAVTGEWRIFKDDVKLHLVPFVFAAADGVAVNQRGVVELMKHGVHGGHAHNVCIAFKAMNSAFLQKFPLSAGQLVANPSPYRQAIRANCFMDKFRAGISQQDMIIGGYEKAPCPTRRVTDGLTYFRVNHLRNDPYEVARGAELGGLLLAAEIAGKYLKEVAFYIRILSHKRNRRNNVNGPPKGSAVRDNDRGIFKYGLCTLGKMRVFGKQGEGVPQSAEHPFIVWVGRQDTPAERFKVNLPLPHLELPK